MYIEKGNFKNIKAREDIQARKIFLGGAGPNFVDSQASLDDPMPPSTELFEFNTPDLVSSTGRTPNAGASFVHFPAKLTYNNTPTYDNQWNKWNGRGTIGVFKATTNLVASPEDLTTSWVNSASTDELSSQYFDGKRFTKIISNATSQKYNEVTITPTLSATTYSMSCIFKKGVSPDPDSTTYFQMYIYDASVNFKLFIKVPWDKSAAFIQSPYGGVVVSYKWYGDVCEVMATSASCTAGASIVEVGMSTTTNNMTGAHWFFATAVQFEQSTYPTPYTPKSRAAGGVVYPVQAGNVLAVEGWIRPLGAYNASEVYPIFYWYDGNGFISLYYLGATTYLYASYGTVGGSAFRAKSSGAFNAASWNTWVHFKVALTYSTRTIRLWVNGVEQTTASDYGADALMDALTQPDALSIGYSPNSTIFGAVCWGNSLITDLLIYPTADMSTTHYTKSRPYYDKNRWLGENSSWRLP